LRPDFDRKAKCVHRGVSVSTHFAYSSTEHRYFVSVQ
jgi:hypothetical protein